MTTNKILTPFTTVAETHCCQFNYEENPKNDHPIVWVSYMEDPFEGHYSLLFGFTPFSVYPPEYRTHTPDETVLTAMLVIELIPFYATLCNLCKKCDELQAAENNKRFPAILEVNANDLRDPEGFTGVNRNLTPKRRKG